MVAHDVGSVVVVGQDGVWGILTREDLAEIAPELLRSAQCAKCSSRRHLHRGVSGAFSCAACEARANADANAISSE
jgi:ribosomal protein L37AE/L43A